MLKLCCHRHFLFQPISAQLTCLQSSPQRPIAAQYPTLIQPISCLLHREFSNHSRTPHEILGLHRNADKKEIKDAFIRLSKIYHPDKNKGDADSTNEFQEIRSAYEALTTAGESHDHQQQQHHHPSEQQQHYRQYEWRQQQEHHKWNSEYRSDYLNRRRKTRSFDDWVKNVEREARVRQKMAKGGDSKDGFNAHTLYSDSFNKTYDRYEQNFVNNLDRAYRYGEFYRKEKGMEETLKHRAFNLFIWLYYIMIRTLVRRGVKLLIVIATMLAVLEYNVAGKDFDVPYDPSSRKD